MSSAAVRDRDLLRRVSNEARPFRVRIVGLLVLSLLATPLALLAPVPLKIVVDSVLGDDPLPGFLSPFVPASLESSDSRLLVLAAVMTVLVVLLIQLQSLAAAVLETVISERLTLGFQARLLTHVQRLSFAFHDRRGTADSIYRIQYDAPAISLLAVSSLVPFVSSGFMLIAMVYVIVLIDWQLAVVALAISPLLFSYARFYRVRMRPRYKETRQLESSALNVVQEVLTGFRVVKAFGREDHERDRYVDRSGEGVRARIRLQFAEGIFGLLVSLTTAIGTALVLYIGVRNVQSGVLTLGALLLVISYLGQLYGPLKTIAQKVASLQNQFAMVQRAFELIDEVPEVDERPDARPLVRAKGAIEVRDVSFGYEPGQRVLEGVNLSVPAGATLGIAGPTGAGKTTFVSLLSRFYDPEDGDIFLDGVDLRDYKLRDLRTQFAIMLQEPVLFSATIAQNIAYARPDASPEEIIEAARAAGAHDFIMELEDGYATVVGERGMRLSGGERQRVSLARAFLKDAPILILDEPTSSVDVVTEAGILEAMNRLMEGRTTLMIAHRLSTLDSCDIRAELDGGRLNVQYPKRKAG